MEESGARLSFGPPRALVLEDQLADRQAFCLALGEKFSATAERMSERCRIGHDAIGTRRALIDDEAAADRIIEAKGLKQISDTGALESIIDEVLAANQKSVEEFRAGKEKAFNALIGQAMKATKGKANPAQVNDLLRKKLQG